MHWVFLIPLTTSLVSGYIFNSCADEMAYLTGVLTVVSIILSLVLAPWQIQLLILIIVILSTRRLLSRNEFDLGGQQSKQPLNYPTVGTYKTNSFISQVTEREMTGKYRGNPCKVGEQQKDTLVKPSSPLKYRGNSIVNQKPQAPQDKSAT